MSTATAKRKRRKSRAGSTQKQSKFSYLLFFPRIILDSFVFLLYSLRSLASPLLAYSLLKPEVIDLNNRNNLSLFLTCSCCYKHSSLSWISFSHLYQMSFAFSYLSLVPSFPSHLSIYHPLPFDSSIVNSIQSLSHHHHLSHTINLWLPIALTMALFSLIDSHSKTIDILFSFRPQQMIPNFS